MSIVALSLVALVAMAGTGGDFSRALTVLAPGNCEPQAAALGRWRSNSEASSGGQTIALTIASDAHGSYVADIQTTVGELSGQILIPALSCAQLLDQVQVHMDALLPEPGRWGLMISAGYRLGLLADHGFDLAAVLSRGRGHWAAELGLHYARGELELPIDAAPGAGPFGIVLHQPYLSSLGCFVARSGDRRFRIPLCLGGQLGVARLREQSDFDTDWEFAKEAIMTGAFLTGVLGLRVAYDTLGSWPSTVIGIDAWVTSRGVMAIPGAHSGSGDAARALATDHTPTLRNMPVGVAAFVAFEFDLSRARKYRGRHRGPQL